MVYTHSLTRYAIIVAVLTFFAPGNVEAEQIKYSGAHPIAGDADGEFCYIEFPHVHVYKPQKANVLYRVENDHYHFVGDPVGFGYDGPKHSYYGHHPVVVNASVYADVDAPVTEYCYINGPHFHSYEPPPELTFTVKGDAYWYIGEFPKPYHKRRKRLVKINAVYEPIVYERPVVVVEAPPMGYVGPVVEVKAAVPDVEVHVPAAVEVHVPAAVEVHLPIPSVELRIGGHVHHEHKKHKKRKFKKFKKRRKGKHKHRH